MVFFNNLAKAGWYEESRKGQGAPWSYAPTWEPIVEPPAVIAQRVEAADEETGERIGWEDGEDFLTLGQVQVETQEWRYLGSRERFTLGTTCPL